MALYGSSRDVSLVRRINRELINDIINTEIIFYKISTQNTKVNIYGESSRKVFFDPMRFNCLISREEKSYFNDDSFSNFTRNARFSFLRDDLKDKSVVLQEGDIIKWDMEYYEINTIIENDLWTGRNPETLPITVDDNRDEFGYNLSIVAVAFKTTPERLGLRDMATPKSSIYDSPQY